MQDIAGADDGVGGAAAAAAAGPPVPDAAPVPGGGGAGGSGGKGVGGKGAGKAPAQVWPGVDIHVEDGTYLGQLKFGEEDQVPSAHCRWCGGGAGGEPLHGLCRINRTVRAGKNVHQGRPIGFLIAWLRLAVIHEDRQSHFDDRKGNDAISLGDRLAARAWTQNEPALGFFLGKEREQRPEEGVEPMLNP